ncbi:DNA-binding FadR family transcriptional regulator [Nocardia sp. GAS34]|uniref:FadR/GntR family transcriptional regulator n=1 Tax=unclassified Nocardia TaxID=2637762 RepID=UPI003D1DF70C
MTDFAGGPLGRHRTMHGRVVDLLGARVVSGIYAENAQLPNESDLASELGVSRGGVREAVKALAAKGLVDPRPRVGTRVLPRSAWNLMDPEVIGWHSTDSSFVRDLLELRLIVEPGAARLAAERVDPAQIAAMTTAYDAMAEHASQLPERSSEFVAADLAFHLALLRASGNQLVEQLGRLLETGLQHGLEATSELPGGVERTLPMHRAVLDAVRRHRPEAAAKASRQLIETTAAAMAARTE